MKRPRTAGFTLLELLVASIVLSLIGLVIVNATRFVSRALAHAGQRREAVESMTTGLGLARGELGQAEPLWRRVGNRDQLLFVGTADRLRFVAISPEYLPGWPLVAYEYALLPGDGRSLLDLRRAGLDPAEPDLAVLDDAESRTLLSFPGSFRFTYFGRGAPKERERWYETWPATAEGLPLAVRIGPADLAASWPDFVFPLRVNTPAGCASNGGGGSGGGGESGAGAGQSSKGCGP